MRAVMRKAEWGSFHALSAPTLLDGRSVLIVILVTVARDEEAYGRGDTLAAAGAAGCWRRRRKRRKPRSDP